MISEVALFKNMLLSKIFLPIFVIIVLYSNLSTMVL
jgi:hypothetical protein